MREIVGGLIGIGTGCAGLVLYHVWSLDRTRQRIAREFRDDLRKIEEQSRERLALLRLEFEAWRR